MSVVILFISEADAMLGDNAQVLVEIVFCISIGLVFIVSIMNFIQYPPPNIFVNYEKLLK